MAWGYESAGIVCPRHAAEGPAARCGGWRWERRRIGSFPAACDDVHDGLGYRRAAPSYRQEGRGGVRTAVRPAAAAAPPVRFAGCGRSPNVGQGPPPNGYAPRRTGTWGGRGRTDACPALAAGSASGPLAIPSATWCSRGIGGVPVHALPHGNRPRRSTHRSCRGSRAAPGLRPHTSSRPVSAATAAGTPTGRATPRPHVRAGRSVRPSRKRSWLSPPKAMPPRRDAATTRSGHA